MDNAFIVIQEKRIEKIRQEVIDTSIKLSDLMDNKTRVSINITRLKVNGCSTIKSCFDKNISELKELLEVKVKQYNLEEERLENLKLEIQQEMEANKELDDEDI